MSLTETREEGYYWIRPYPDDRWEIAKWCTGGWTSDTNGTWWTIGGDVPLWEPEDLARVEVGPRIADYC